MVSFCKKLQAKNIYSHRVLKMLQYNTAQENCD